MDRPARCVAAVLACAGAAGGCVESDDPAWGEVDLRCEMGYSESAFGEQISARLFAPGAPAELTWTRSGQPVGTWTWAYDGERRMIAEERDQFGPGGVPDGAPDLRRELAYAGDEVVESLFDVQSMSAVPIETTRWRLDGLGWVREIVTRGARQELVVTSEGWIERMQLDADDPDLGAFTTIEVFRRTAEDLLEQRLTSDTRFESTHVTDYVHTMAGSTHRVRVMFEDPSFVMEFAYARDAEGRMVRAATDETGDGREDWVVDFAYAPDRALRVTSSRDGQVFRTHAYSAGCGKVFEEPWAPRSGQRPGPLWMMLDPPIPTPF